MKNQRPYRLLILVVVLTLMCVATLNVVFLPVTSAKATLPLYPTPTSVPTHSITPGPTIIPSPTAGTGTSCKVTYTIVAQWPGSFITQLVLANTGSTAINGWSLKFTFPNGQVITSLFNGVYTQTGANVTISNRPWNGSIAPGTTLLTEPGFVATQNGTNNPPASFTLNGTLCSKG